jgi:hypothetical protein
MLWRAKAPSELRAPLWALPLAIFALTRAVDTVLLLLMGGHQELGRNATPYMHVVDPAPPSPGYFDLITNWDGQWYQDIAEHGYPSDLPRDEDGAVQQNVWGFAPLYPALVRAAMSLTSLPFAPAASLVSVLTAATAMMLLFRLLHPRVGVFNASMTVLALSMSPAGVILQAAYSESLALLVLVGCLTLLVERRYGGLAILAVALALTRPIVLPFALLLGLHGVLRWRRRGEDPFPAWERRRWLLATAVALASSALGPALCAVWTGEPNGYMESHRAWTASVGPPRNWIAAIIDQPLGKPAIMVAIAAVALVVILGRPSARQWGTELRLWVPVYALFILVTTGPLGGYVRYAVLALVPWWPATNPMPPSRARAAILAGFVAVFGVLTQVVWLRYGYLMGNDIRIVP